MSAITFVQFLSFVTIAFARKRKGDLKEGEEQHQGFHEFCLAESVKKSSEVSKELSAEIFLAGSNIFEISFDVFFGASGTVPI